jgi:hypothetical protein
MAKDAKAPESKPEAEKAPEAAGHTLGLGAGYDIAPPATVSAKARAQGLDTVPPAPRGLVDASALLRGLGIVGWRDLGAGVQVDVKAGGSITFHEDRLTS